MQRVLNFGVFIGLTRFSPVVTKVELATVGLSISLGHPDI